MSQRSNSIEPAVRELEESWFNRPHQKPSTRPPPGLASEPPRPADPIGDPVADDWFR
jgi:hypothetical protein